MATAPDADAHGVPVHKAILSEAIELLNTPDLQPVYTELKAFEQSLRDGVTHEDCVDPNYLPESLNGDFNDLCWAGFSVVV